jgi:hypothetical protein
VKRHGRGSKSGAEKYCDAGKLGGREKDRSALGKERLGSTGGILSRAKAARQIFLKNQGGGEDKGGRRL